MDWNIIMGGIWDHVMIPIIIAIGVALAFVVKHYADKVSKSIVAKNEISAMEKQSSVRKELLTTLSTIVEAAVGSNMQIANTMKASGQKLTPEQISELNQSAKKLVINSLPPSLTNENGVLLEIIGGKEKLDAVIDSMMEKYVYEYKIKAKQQAPVQATEVPKTNPFYNKLL